MNPERFREVERIYSEARELPQAAREDFARRECGGDAEVLSEVLRLLRATEPTADFIEPPSSGDSGFQSRLPARLGEFQLLEEIGRGAMGIVFRATQEPLGRVVAVKVLPPGLALSDKKVSRFLQEARAAAKLSHPHVVPIITVGEDKGIRYFAMEYVEGHNLATELRFIHRALRNEEVRPPHLPDSRSHEYFRSVARMARDVADGLQHAHEHGVIHRDIKPSNLQLDEHGSVHVVDFGLARDEGQPRLSRTGDVAGTPHYMSPEQAMARRHRIDHRTDVYSLGVVLYELLTLRRPFEGKSDSEVIEKLLRTEATRIRRLNKRVPRDLEVICSTAMAKDARERYATAGEFRDDLDRFLTHQAIHARPPSPLQLAARLGRRHVRLLAAVAFALLALAAGWWWSAHQAWEGRMREHLDAIAAARAEGHVRDLPLARQLDLRGHLRELRVDGEIRAAEAVDPVTELERQFEEYRVELRERGLNQLARGRDRSLSEGAREASRLGGLLTLMYAAQLFPEDDELRGQASVESAFPTIAVRALDPDGALIPATVHLRPIDPMTTAVGERHLLGRTPLPPTPVEPGYYRVVVEFDEGGFRELVCDPGPAFMAIELKATRSANEAAVLDGMVAYEASDFTFADFPGGPSFQGKTMHLDAFLMDETEVSNSDYYRFLQATGTRRPGYWRFVEDLVTFLAEYGDHPATGMSWNDARAYAEWAGKRLPTLSEWHRAAGGLQNWPFPWSSDPQAEIRGNVLQPTALGGEEDFWAGYLKSSRPVRSFEDARTPEGLYHMYGNVHEWTESMAVSLTTAEELTPKAFERFRAGHAWDAVAKGMGMRTASFFGIGPNYGVEYVGFRCAKSVTP